jgi:TetR/AcrR family transcriptional regulator, transcriptional repressor for nem operon
MAALAADARLRPAATRSAITTAIRSQIEGMEAALPDTFPGDRRREAIGTYAAMLGALILARAVDAPSLSDEILGEAREWLGRDD